MDSDKLGKIVTLNCEGVDPVKKNGFVKIFKKISCLTGILAIALLFINSNPMLQKQYSLVFFKFGPEDIDIKVFPETGATQTDEENTDYIISRIENNSAHLFLVRDFANERDFITYTYRVVFYKVQELGKETVRVPVYTFRITFEGDDAVVIYEPSKAIPREIKDNGLRKVFKKDPNSNIYFIKDYTGDDFNLAERMRTVRFTGTIRNQNGTETAINNDHNVKVKLMKLDDASLYDQTIDVYDDSIISVPLNQDITLGLVPYKISNTSELDRYVVESLIVGGKEKETLLIHFAEVWNNMYDQQLVFVDEGYFTDFYFDENLYDLTYTLGNDKPKKQVNPPLSLSLKKHDGKDLYLRLTARDFVVKYLAHPTHEITYTLTDDKKAIEVLTEINENNRYTEIREDGSLTILPNFKKTPLAIFTFPERAKLTYTKLDPVSGAGEPEAIDIGEAPVFFTDLDYGKYRIVANWYDKNEDQATITSWTKSSVIEFAGDGINNKEIQFLEKNDTRIPYMLFTLDDESERGEITIDRGTTVTESVEDMTTDTVNSDNDTRVSDSTRDSNGNVYYSMSDNEKDELVSQISFLEYKIDNLEKQLSTLRDQSGDRIIVKQVSDTSSDYSMDFEKMATISLNSINKGSDTSGQTGVYIQIAAFKEDEKPMSFINYYVEQYLDRYKSVTEKSHSTLPRIAKKMVNDTPYIAVVFGPYTEMNEARREINTIHKVINDAFIVRETILEEYR
jgi:hypothetical protein